MSLEEVKKEYNRLKAETEAYYKNNVQDIFLQLEKKRVLFCTLSILCWVVLITSTVISILIWTNQLFDLEELGKVYVLYAFIFILLSGMFLIDFFPRNYKEKLKENYNLLLKPLALNQNNSYSQNLQYSVDNSNLFASSNNIVCQDRFTGKYENIDLEIAEAKITPGADDSDIILSSAFSGYAITFNFNKENKTLTHIRPKYGRVNSKSGLSASNLWAKLFFPGAWAMVITMLFEGFIHQDTMTVVMGCFFLLFVSFFAYYFFCVIKKPKQKKNIRKLEQVHIEDIEFSKHYEIFSNDQIESRYLITTAFLERFLYLSNVFKTKKIYCSLFEQQMLLLIESKKDLFEIGSLFTSLKNPKYINQFYDEIIAVLLLINHFKINENTKL